METEDLLRNFLTDGVQSPVYDNHGRFKLGAKFLNGDARIKLERVNISGGSFKLKATLPTHPDADWTPSPYILAQDKLVWMPTGNSTQVNEFLSDEYNDNSEVIFISISKSGSREDRIKFITKADLSSMAAEDTIVAAYVRFNSWLLVDKNNFFNSTLPKAHHQTERFDASMFGLNPLLDGEEPYDMSEIISTAFRTAELMGMSELCIPEGRYTIDGYPSFGNNIDVKGIGKVVFEAMYPYTPNGSLDMRSQGPTNTMENITFKNCFFRSGTEYGNQEVNQTFRNLIFDCPDIDRGGISFFTCSRNIGGGRWTFDNITINIQQASRGIWVDNADFVEIKNCNITGCIGTPIWLRAPYSAKIQNNRIEGIDYGNGTGISVESRQFQLSKNIIIENNVISGCSGDGIALGTIENAESQPIFAKSNIASAFVGNDRLLCIELINSTKFIPGGQSVLVDITTIAPDKCLFVFAKDTGLDGDYYLIKEIYEENGRKIVKLATTISDASCILTGSATEANICTGFLDCVIRDNTLSDIGAPNTNDGVAILLRQNVFGITVSNNKIYNGNVGIVASAGRISSGLASASNIKILDNYCIGLKLDAIQLEDGYSDMINRNNVIKGNTLIRCRNVSVRGQENLVFSNNVLRKTNLNLIRVDKAILSENYITGDVNQTEMGDDVHFIGNTGSENLEMYDEVIRKEEILKNILADGVQSAFYENYGKFKHGAKFLNGDGRVKLEKVNIGGGSFRLKITLPTNPDADWWPNPYILAQDKLVWGITQSNTQVNEFLSDEYNDNSEVIFISISKSGSREDRIKFITKADLSSMEADDTIVAAYVRFNSWFLVDKNDFFNSTLPKVHHQTQRFDASMFGVNPLGEGEESYDMSDVISTAFRAAELMGMSELCIPEGRYTFNGNIGFGRNIDVRGIGKVIFEPMQPYTSGSPVEIIAQGPTNKMENITFKNCYLRGGTGFPQGTVVNQAFKDIVIDAPEMEGGGYMWLCSVDGGGGNWKFENIDINVKQSYVGIMAENVDFVEIKNCNIKGAFSHPIRLMGVKSAEIKNNYVEGTEGGNITGIFLGTNQFQLTRNVIIENNVVCNCRSEYISLDGFGNNTYLAPIMAQCNIEEAFVDPSDGHLCLSLTNAIRKGHYDPDVYPDITEFDPEKFIFTFVTNTGLDGEYYMIHSIYNDNGKKIVKLRNTAFTNDTVLRITPGANTQVNICTGFLDCVIKHNTIYGNSEMGGGNGISLHLSQYGTTVFDNKVTGTVGGMTVTGGHIFSGETLASGVKVLNNHFIDVKDNLGLWGAPSSLRMSNYLGVSLNNEVSGNTFVRCSPILVAEQKDLMFTNNMLKETDLGLTKIDDALFANNYIRGTVTENQVGANCHVLNNIGL